MNVLCLVLSMGLAMITVSCATSGYDQEVLSGRLDLAPDEDLPVIYKKVVRLGRNDPDYNCEELGSVKGSRAGFLSSSDEDGKESLRADGARLGANYVRMENFDERWVTGTAFLCR